jgi:hypothetical protein
MKGAFVGEKNFDVIKIHGTTIKTPSHNFTRQTRKRPD